MHLNIYLYILLFGRNIKIHLNVDIYIYRWSIRCKCIFTRLRRQTRYVYARMSRTKYNKYLNWWCCVIYINIVFSMILSLFWKGYASACKICCNDCLPSFDRISLNVLMKSQINDFRRTFLLSHNKYWEYRLWNRIRFLRSFCSERKTFIKFQQSLTDVYQNYFV